MADHIAAVGCGVIMKIKPVPKFHDGHLGAALAVRVKANAKRSQIRKIDSEGTIHVDLVGPESEDIDLRLTIFLAGELRVKPAQLEVIGKSDSNARLVMILGTTAEEIERKFISMRD